MRGREDASDGEGLPGGERPGGQAVQHRGAPDPPGGGGRRRGYRDRGEVQGGGPAVLGAQPAACVRHAFVREWDALVYDQEAARA